MPASVSTSNLDSPSHTWAQRLTSPLAAAVVLALFYVALLASVASKSVTFDEPVHLTAGYTYWKKGDYRVQPENGNLPQRWFALPLLGRDLAKPETFTNTNDAAPTWRMSHGWLNQAPEARATLVHSGRAFAGLLAVALGFVVWRWASALFGRTGGMLALLLYVLNPAILANGALMTSDIAGALFFLLSVGALWRVLHAVTWQNILLGGFALGGLCVSKMSAPLIVPIAGVLLAVRLLQRKSLPVGRWVVALRWPQLAVFGGAAVAQALVAVAVIWACYGFRYSAFSPTAPTPARFDRPWSYVLDRDPPMVVLQGLRLDPPTLTRAQQLFASHGAPLGIWTFPALDAFAELQRTVLDSERAAELNLWLEVTPRERIPKLIHLAAKHHLLPEAFLYGYAHVWKFSRARSAFLNGEISDRGWRVFFPYAFAVKTPLLLLPLALLALGAALWRARAPRAASGISGSDISTPPVTTTTSSRSLSASPLLTALLVTLPLWTLLVLYAGTAILSNINIGHRHLLPLYPPLFILCGASAWWLRRPRSESALPRFAVLVCVAVLAVETAARFPNYLAYFNGIVRPAQAYRHLVDSSLDWGQELPALAKRLAREPADKPAYLAYFGMASPRMHDVHARVIHSYPWFAQHDSPPLRILSLPAASRAEGIAEFVRQNPDYDSRLVFDRAPGQSADAVIVKHAAALRLTPGLYCISATLVQPVFFLNAPGPWSAQHESNYQQLLKRVQPVLDDDPARRAAALITQGLEEWMRTFELFDELRCARLCAYLRKREPDETINYAILLYRLSETDLRAALEGPAP